MLSRGSLLWLIMRGDFLLADFEEVVVVTVLLGSGRSRVSIGQ